MKNIEPTIERVPPDTTLNTQHATASLAGILCIWYLPNGPHAVYYVAARVCSGGDIRRSYGQQHSGDFLVLLGLLELLEKILFQHLAYLFLSCFQSVNFVVLVSPRIQRLMV